MRPSYRVLIDDVSDGKLISSRYGDCLELLDVGVDFRPGELISRKGFNKRLAFMELLQVLAGVFNFEALERVAPKAALGLFSEDGAYGPRLATQLQLIVHELARNPGTRQAVAFVGRPHDTCSNSLPCTGMMQFILRDRRLYCFVTMRSWDLIKGLPYDIAVFGGVTAAVARVLGAVPTRVHVRAGSGHLYLDDSPKAEGIRPAAELFTFTQQVPRTWEGIRDWAHTQVHEAIKLVDLSRWPADIRLLGEEPEDA